MAELYKNVFSSQKGRQSIPTTSLNHQDGLKVGGLELKPACSHFRREESGVGGQTVLRVTGCKLYTGFFGCKGLGFTSGSEVEINFTSM